MGGGAGTEFQKGFGHLSESEGVVKWCDGDVAAVEDGVRRCVGV